MNKLISSAFRWLGAKALSLLLIMALLVAGVWVQGELKRADQLVLERTDLLFRKDDVLVRYRHVSEAGAQLKLAKRKALTLQALIDRRLQARGQIVAAHPVVHLVPLTDPWKQIQAMDVEIGAYQQTLAQVNAANALTERQLGALQARMTAELQGIERRMAGIDDALQQGYVPRFLGVMRDQLPAAVAILIALMLVPIVIKLLLYFVVAPMATGRPSIRIVEGGPDFGPMQAARLGPTGGRISAVSVPVVLAPDEELLIQPDYLQSTSILARKETRWLLNSSIPFSSVLSGMFMLTRVTPSGGEPVVLSATKDSLSEVGILHLADGEAFVCQPRSLVGVVQCPARPMRITRHWRLGHLQSWLTLQLRFLAFHGPARLVLKGCRGIRVEVAGQGRLVNQAATLGFSANTAYANTRCETFVSYWSGKEDLFNDLFTGGGIYVYEETTDPNRRTGITGRGLQGLSDALLKMLGV